MSVYAGISSKAVQVSGNISDNANDLLANIAQLAGAIEYTDCFSEER